MVTIGALLVVAAFMLSVIAILLSFTWRWQALILKNRGDQGAVQSDGAMGDPQTFKAAVAASKATRGARLARQERLREILTPIAFGLSGLPVILALAALVLAGDREAAIVCAIAATTALSFTTAAYFAAKHGRRKATQSALQADHSQV